MTTRLEQFNELLDKMEAEEIPLDGREAQAIARSATSELGISQKIDKLEDLELEKLSDYEITRILARARSAIKRVLELRKRFAPILRKQVQPDGTETQIRIGTAGPYYSNRKQRRKLEKKTGLRAAQRSSIASNITRG
jgi:hypothetical protein